MYGVEVLEVRSVKGAMDSLTECNDGGASSGELEYLSEDFRFKLPAIVPVLKEVHEGDRGGVDPAGAERGMQTAIRQAAVRPADTHGARPPRATLADKDQVGHELASGGAGRHARRGRAAGI
jgi:hypothetical protein